MNARHLSIAVVTMLGAAACARDIASPSSGLRAGERASSTVSAGGRVVVTEQDIAREPEDAPPTRNWVFYTRPASPATGAFIPGPDSPPLGAGSFQITTASGSDKGYLFNFDYVGTPLSAVSAIGYSTYRTAAANPAQVTALNIQIDYNGPNAAGGFSNLVFEPIYNTDQGAIADGVWQSWDAYEGGNAIWWSSKPIPGVCAFNCFVSWNDILAANPDAVILGGVGLNQGSGNPGLISASDALSFGVNGSTTTYDFEPYRTPSTKDDCKNGGWQSLRRADGSSFRNQGDCVSYVNHG